VLSSRTRSTRLPAGVVATGLAAVLAASSASAVYLGAADTSASASATPIEAGLAEAPARADQAEAPARADQAQEAVPPSDAGAPAADVAPLGDLRAPDVLVRATGPIPADLLERLRAVEGVAASALLDAGTVTVGGEPSALIGVDPSQFRAFTPQETAASDPLWQAVARGDLAVTFAVQQQRGLQLGADVPVDERSGRLGAVAAFGLPAADVVTSRALARELGAVPDAVLLLSAPEVTTAALTTVVEEVAGATLEVEVLRPEEVAPSRLQGRPDSWRELYIDSARYCPGLSWTILASIGQIESAHGKNLGPSSAGALGPMQFMPATWAAYGIDGDGDGVADIMNPFDAVPSAASYLCRHGATRGDQGLYNAIFAYNRADWYVRQVLDLAAQIS
jgi:hypothetical protein